MDLRLWFFVLWKSPQTLVLGSEEEKYKVETMSQCQCSTPRRRSSGHNDSRRGAFGRFGSDEHVHYVLMSVRFLIDDWEDSIVAQQLALACAAEKINHYWVVKIMMGLLMEDIQSKWRISKEAILDMRVSMEQTINCLNNVDDNFDWEHSLFIKRFEVIGVSTHGLSDENLKGDPRKVRLWDPMIKQH